MSEGEDQGPDDGADTGAESITERVAAILAADAVGYSRLMADDEQATVKTLDQARDVFRRHVEANRGRVVDTAGDSVLAVFETTSGAVRASVAIQDGLQELNADTPNERQMQFRIGIHLGDIMEKPSDGTIYGDGVNVAARLEALSDPGGIIVSDSVHASLRGRIEVSFEFLGSHEGKNLKEPVNAYRVLPEGEEPEKPTGKPRIPLTGVVAAGIAAIVVVAGVVWWQMQEPEPPQMVTADGAPTDDPMLAMPTGPTIAVLPFDNMSGDPGQEFFADGITEEIITGLSRFSNLQVLARNTTFQFKGEAIDVAELGQRLGVDYLVEGSVQRDATTVRVTAQLLDAGDGAHVWAESYERELLAKSLFAVQDDITAQIISEIGDIHGAVSRADMQALRHKVDVAVRDYDCILLAYEYQRFLTPDKHGPVKACLQETVERNPAYTEAWANLAYTYVDQYWAGYEGPEGPLDLAVAAARKAVELDATSQIAHFALANSYFFLDEIDAFIIEAEKALRLNPNNTEIIAAIGVRFTYAEQRERGVALIEKAIQLNPAHPGWYWFPVAFHHYRLRDYETALAFLRRADMPGFWPYQWFLAALYGQLGDEEHARTTVAQLNALNPSFKDNPEPFIKMWFKSNEAVAQWMEGLEKAGLFDEPEPPSRPVIAVLPFDNLSGDLEQEYFADGLIEDIITRLSYFEEIGVIARNSTFQFKGQAVDVRDVGSNLGATHVLEGSVRRSSDQVRVTAQLLSASDGQHLWAHTYERDLSTASIFDLQAEIAVQVAATIGDIQGPIALERVGDVRSEAPDNLHSYDCVLLAHAYMREVTGEILRKATECLEQTVAEEPGYADAWSWLAQLYHESMYWDDPPDVMEKSEHAARQALQTDPGNQRAKMVLATVHFMNRKLVEFERVAESAIAENPNNTDVLAELSVHYYIGGNWERGLELMDAALALSPNPPGWYYNPGIFENYRLGHYEDALSEARKVQIPDWFWDWVFQLYCLGQLGRTDEAKPAIESLLTLYPDFHLHAYDVFERWWYNQPELMAKFLEGLRKAGLDVPLADIERAASQG